MSISLSREQFREIPDVVGDPRFHRRGNAERAMNAAEDVVGEIQAERGPVVLKLGADAVGQAGETPNLHAHGKILTLDVRGTNAARIRIAENWDHPRLRLPLHSWIMIKGVQSHESPSSTFRPHHRMSRR
jgi:hypothetical protein